MPTRESPVMPLVRVRALLDALRRYAGMFNHAAVIH